MLAPRLIPAATALVLAALAAAPAHAGDPHRAWHTIESRHFVIHYYEPLDDVAHRVAVVAERSHDVLTHAFAHWPEEKTQIVIVDDTDGANGFASVLPRNAIRLFATAPTSGSSLNDHDDWLYGLTAHEYTHIVHLDSIRGLPKLYNRIFGKTWAPNQIQPRWVIEGIATYEESKRSSSGRTRNAIFDMNLRAVTLADQRLDLDEVTNSPRAWPRGNAAYLYGSHFLRYVFDRFGDDTARELSWAYGSNPIPYGLNHTIKKLTGRSFEELYADWNAYLRDKYTMQLEAVERQGRREGRQLTFTREANANPRYTRDGAHIIWLQQDGYTESRIRIMPVGATAREARTYTDIERLGVFAPMSDGSLVVEQTTIYRGNYSFQDLHVWDARTRTLREITRGLRARSPALSPDERMVAFAINGKSRTQLAVMPLLPEAEHRILWRSPGRFDQVQDPAWSPDGRAIAVSVWQAGGARDIAVIDVATGEATYVTRDRALDVRPVFSPDGAYLYYSSDRSGIYNIYAYERATGQTYQVTNVVGGALEPDVSPDGRRMVYQSFGVGGFDLYEIELDKGDWLTPAPYIDDRPDPVEIRDAHVEIAPPRPYRPLETLAPQSYTVLLGVNSFGNTLNVQTGGSDVVGQHAYSLSATLNLDNKDVSASGAYSYRRLWPSLRVAAARVANRRGGVILDSVNTQFTEERYGLTLSAGLPVLNEPRGSGSISLDYDLDWLRGTHDQYDEPDPGEALPQFPETDVVVAGLALRFSYSDTRNYIYTVGPQAGQSFSASLRANHPALGSDFRSLSLDYQWSTFKKLPWGETPVLSFNLAGGIRSTDRNRSNPFVLGGVPEQDVTQSVLDNIRAARSGYLRGFPSRSIVGRQFHLANIEYRQLLFELERGFSTLPFYLQRVHIAGLLDVGNAFDGELDPRDFHVAVGGSVRLDMLFGYFVPGALDLGYARGLTDGGVGEFWMLLTGTL